VLSANRTYYVRTDGSDANNGLANTAGGAFLTVQKAIDTVAAIDLSSYAVTIQMADGTYSGPVILKAYVGAGPVTIQGNTGTPSNVVLNSTSGHLLDVGVTHKYVLNGIKLQTSGGLYLPLYVHDGAHLELKNVVFAHPASGWACTCRPVPASTYGAPSPSRRAWAGGRGSRCARSSTASAKPLP
jgi:hypothetical protein